jgi:hypothetical protein
MVEIKVQTDGSKTPAMAVIEACDKTLNHITAIQNSFEVSRAADIFSLISETYFFKNLHSLQNALKLYKEEKTGVSYHQMPRHMTLNPQQNWY